MSAAATIGVMGREGTRGSVLVVEDEPTIAEVVSRYLERAGYETAIATDGLEAMRLAEAGQPDLVVLDLMLPMLDGVEVLRRLRKHASGGPAVIMLTAKGEQDDKIAGLRSGADDYVVKPFSPSELVARVDAVLRRAHPAPKTRAEPLRFDGLEIDVAGRKVVAGGAPVQLSQREFDLLEFLASHPGQAFSRDQLMDRVWDSAFLSDAGTVTVHVRRLRTKIEPDPERPRFIQTVWGVGYRFEP